MLELRDVRKSYTTGSFTQAALDGVSIEFRDNEFVAILGPSGSGKTTLLNIVGGLDHYDSGDLVIDGVSTERYGDRDWDAYRNNRIGFVFQSYNLIPHQTVLANVELALTLSGVAPAERRRRAMAALDEVGLEEHAHNKPSQLSGGQQQRVAIARALVNDPPILLADEPTGALDSKTSIQIMGLLTAIAADRLVIMVTHNPELAEEYATRIVSLSDGRVAQDTNPVVAATEAPRQAEAARRTSMSFLTALGLSFSNLMTKKGRTLMTSFAGSIGIIGIAAILALANGVNAYIKKVEEDTLSMYPLTIQAQGFDMTSMLAASSGLAQDAHGSTGAEVEVREVPLMAKMFSSIGTNDLASLKLFIDDDGGGLRSLVSAVEYSYDVTPQIFSADTSNGPRQVSPDSALAAMGFRDMGSSALSAGMRTSVFSELVGTRSLVDEHYDVVAGRWPTHHDEMVVVLTESGGISDLALYAMGLRDPAELDAMVRDLREERDISPPTDTKSFTYAEVMAARFRLVAATDYYVYDNAFRVWADRSGDEARLKELVDEGEELRIVGVLRPNGDGPLSPGIYYTPELTAHIISQADGQQVVRDQLADPSMDIFTGQSFGSEPPPEEQLDLSSLFTIDEAAIAKAFKIDESALTFDLAGLDLDLSMPAIDLDPAKLRRWTCRLCSAGVLTSNPWCPLATPQLPEVQLPDVAPEQWGALLDAAVPLVQGYTTYAASFGLDPADVATVMPEYLATPEAMAALAAAPEAIGIDRTELTAAITNYVAWSAQRGLPPTDLQANFQAFVQEQSRTAMDQALASIDTSRLERQLQTELSSYLQQVMGSVMGDVTSQLGDTLRDQLGGAMESAMGDLPQKLQSAVSIDQDAFMAAFQPTKNREELAQVFMSMASRETASYESNLRKLGHAFLDQPSRIDIYPVDFESKGQVTTILDGYNERMRSAGNESKVITYTDLVGALMSSVTDIVNMISYVLIAFVAISLVVSSIAIGVITYISVLERKKEIGILRAVGASKRDIRRVFNAETIIVGFVAGLLGVGITALLTMPANAIVLHNFDVPNIAVLPWQAALVLVAVSMALTALAGLMPASSASRKDPVEALRSE